MRLAALLLTLGAPRAGALEWTPIASAVALGGVHRFEGSPSALSGNAEALLAPAGEINERWSLLPAARLRYEGTRAAADILGTATPAQERLEARVSLRAVWAPPSSPWRLKPGVSYKFSWLKETSDEPWGRGLFDERLWTMGLEAERLTQEPHSLRVSADWFNASYPHYTSLESQAALQFAGQPLARELVGDRVLDRRGLRAGLSADVPLGERWSGEGAVSTIWSSYPHQRVVNDTGVFEDRDREDFLSSVSLSARRTHEWNVDLRALASLTLNAGFLSSNQNGYDASRGRFLSRGYDYRELGVSPALRLLFGPGRRTPALDLGLGWRRREYPQRPAQDGSGAYGAEPLRNDEWTLSGTLSYPIARRLSLLFTLERVSASSNQRFQRFYRYAYEATNLLAGARWDW